MAESPEVYCWGERYGRSFDCASCVKPQDASLRMTVLGGSIEAGELVGGFFFEAVVGADGVADEGEWRPGAYGEALTGHEAAAVGDGEEGAPEFVERAAVLAEAVAGGEIEHPDTDGGEHEQAGDPDVTRDVVALNFGDDEAGDHGYKDDEQRTDFFRAGGFGVGVSDVAHSKDRGDHDEHGEHGMNGEPKGLAAEVADGFALGNFEVVCCGHG